MTSELLALADRVEAAKGPDRELDAAIYIAVTNALGHKVSRQADGEIKVEPRGGDSSFCIQRQMILAYTASLDAAMTLVPEGCVWSIMIDY